MTEIFDTQTQSVVSLSTLKANFRKLFDEVLECEGESVLPNTKTDYIISVMKTQKFWSANGVRVFWYNDGKFFDVESRW
jgi:hypothetical protein